MASSEDETIDETRGTLGNFEEMEIQFKKDKARVKSNFTRSRNKVLNLFDQDDVLSRKDVCQARQNMDTCEAIAIEVLSNLADFYTKYSEVKKSKLIVRKMDRIEDDFYATSESAREYLESRKGDNSSVSSDILTINLLEQMNISDHSETYLKQGSVPSQQRGSANVNALRNCRNSGEAIDGFPTHVNSPVASPSESTAERHCMHVESGPILIGNRHDAHPQHPTEPHTKQVSHTTDTSPLNVPFENAYTAPSIGHDLWRQLKRVQIPVISGEKRQYQSWKADFLACIDSAPVTGEYKLLQLRQYLTGDALRVIENLGHSTTAYEAAKGG